MIELYIMTINDFCFAVNDYISYVSRERREKIRKYKLRADKLRSVLSELMLRKILTGKFGFRNSEIVFEYGIYGKPYINNARSIEFNISHADSVIAIAVGDCAVGVDVEMLRDAPLNVACFFTDNEVDYINHAKSISMRSICFFTVWTMKEAFVKAKGISLAPQLKSFDTIANINEFITIIENGYIVSIYVPNRESVVVHYISSNELLAGYIR